MESKEELGDLREQVAETTSEIVKLVARRDRLAKRIGEIKAKGALPMESERVEDALFKRVMKECRDLGLDQRFGAKLLSMLISESKKVQGIKAAQPLITPMMMMAKATELERKGKKKLIRLDVGEPDFHPPKAVLDAVSGALYSFKTYYTVGRGIPELLGALQAYMERRHGYRPDEKQLMVTPGGRFAVYAALATTLAEGDSAVVIEPNWPAYKEGMDYVGAKAITVRTSLEDGWEASPEEIKASIRPSTKAIILSYPCNPTGKIISKAAFKEIVGIADDAGLTVISDEIYNDYAYKPCPTILEDLPERYVLTSSFSKAWSMTGFRIGYALAPPETVSRMLKVLGLMITCVPEFIQLGAVKALESEKEVARNSREMKERIEAVAKELDKVEGLEYYKPDGSIYVFPQAVDRKFDSSSFAMELIEKEGVTISPGTGFGDYPRCFRISLGRPKETLVAGVRKMGGLLA